MACMRSAVRSRYSPPKNSKPQGQKPCGFLFIEIAAEPRITAPKGATFPVFVSRQQNMEAPIFGAMRAFLNRHGKLMHGGTIGNAPGIDWAARIECLKTRVRRCAQHNEQTEALFYQTKPRFAIPQGIFSPINPRCRQSRFACSRQP